MGLCFMKSIVPFHKSFILEMVGNNHRIQSILSVLKWLKLGIVCGLFRVNFMFEGFKTLLDILKVVFLNSAVLSKSNKLIVETFEFDFNLCLKACYMSSLWSNQVLIIFHDGLLLSIYSCKDAIVGCCPRSPSLNCMTIMPENFLICMALVMVYFFSFCFTIACVIKSAYLSSIPQFLLLWVASWVPEDNPLFVEFI